PLCAVPSPLRQLSRIGECLPYPALAMSRRFGMSIGDNLTRHLLEPGMRIGDRLRLHLLQGTRKRLLDDVLSLLKGDRVPRLDPKDQVSLIPPVEGFKVHKCNHDPGNIVGEVPVGIDPWKYPTSICTGPGELISHERPLGTARDPSPGEPACRG